MSKKILFWGGLLSVIAYATYKKGAKIYSSIVESTDRISFALSGFGKVTISDGFVNIPLKITIDNPTKLEGKIDDCNITVFGLDDKEEKTKIFTSRPADAIGVEILANNTAKIELTLKTAISSILINAANLYNNKNLLVVVQPTVAGVILPEQSIVLEFDVSNSVSTVVDAAKSLYNSIFA